MCPFVCLAVLFSLFMFLMELTAAITVKFYPSQLNETILEGDYRHMYATIEDPGGLMKGKSYEVFSENPDIADVKNQTYILNEDSSVLNVSFFIKGNFLGITKLRVSEKENGNGSKTLSSAILDVRIMKRKRAITVAFTTCVIVLMSFNFINMGCALDLNVVKSVLKKPIAPCVGFVCQYGLMPLIAYGLAQVLFSDDVVLQLGLFTYACSPGGGASNMWTVFLKGNLNLSLTMTFISNLAALAMMPLWFFTLGRTLFSGIKTKVPYRNIFQFLGIMLITLAIGVGFQKYLPRVAKFCRRILAPASVMMIIIIIFFGTYAYLFMFRLFTWKIVLAATINVWLGFLFGAIASRAINLPLEDVIAIAVETGIQNTGIAFVLLQVTLPEPEKDLASIVPIAGSIMTPIPLLFVYCMQVIWRRCFRKSQREQAYISDDEEKRSLPMPCSTDPIFPNSNDSIR